MPLYKISQTKFTGYDMYLSAVVCAGSEGEARLIHPDGSGEKWDPLPSVQRHPFESPNRLWMMAWVKPEDVIVTLIGTEDPSIKNGEVVCADFNAG